MHRADDRLDSLHTEQKSQNKKARASSLVIFRRCHISGTFTR